MVFCDLIRHSSAKSSDNENAVFVSARLCSRSPRPRGACSLPRAPDRRSAHSRRYCAEAPSRACCRLPAARKSALAAGARSLTPTQRRAARIPAKSSPLAPSCPRQSGHRRPRGSVCGRCRLLRSGRCDCLTTAAAGKRCEENPQTKQQFDMRSSVTLSHFTPHFEKL